MALDLDQIRKQVPQAAGWSDQRLMQYYYWKVAEPRGMSWQVFAQSVGYEPPPAPTFRQKLDDAWDKASSFIGNTEAQALSGVLHTPERVLGLADVGITGLENLLTQGASSITATAGELTRPGGSASNIPEATQEVERGMGGPYIPLTEEGREIQSDIGEIDTALEKHVPNFLKPSVESEAAYEHFGPAAGAVAKVALPAVAAVLSMDTPISRAITENVSEPLQEAIGKGVTKAMTKTEFTRNWLAARRAEDRLWMHAGQIDAANEEANQILNRWAKLDLTDEDRRALFKFQEDPEFPLTERQQAAYTSIYPDIKAEGWEPGYVHRIPIRTQEGGAGRILSALRHADRPSIAPRVSLEEGAQEERQMYKLVPVGESGEEIGFQQESPSLYRETAPSGFPSGAIDFLPNGRANDLAASPVLVANEKYYALGQGENKGVILEFKGNSLKTELHEKPGQEVLTNRGYREYKTFGKQKDYINALKSVTVPADYESGFIEGNLNHDSALLMSRLDSLVRNEKWEKIPNEDGSVTYKKPIETNPIAEQGDGTSPAIAYIHKDEYTLPEAEKSIGIRQRSVVGIRNGQSFEVGQLHLKPDQKIEGQTITDSTGQQWKIENATASEIERHSGVVYHHDLGISLAEARRQRLSRIATENLLNDLKTNPDFMGLIQKKTGEDKPGWSSFENPHLNGYMAPKRLQRTIDTVLGSHRSFGELGGAGGMINTAMLRANFLVNIWHMENIGEMALTEGVPDLAKIKFFNGMGSPGVVKSVSQVTSGGEDYLTLMRDGFPFMRVRTLDKGIYRNAVSSLVKEVDGPQIRELVRQGRLDESTLKYLGDGLKGYLTTAGNKSLHGLDMYEGWPIWTMDDAVKLRAVYSRMDRTGEDLLTSGRKVAKEFPQYRLRYSTPGLGPLMDGMQRSGLLWFLPYHVDRFAILARRLGKATTLDPRAIGQLLASAAIVSIVYPTLDDAVQRAFHSSKAHVERFGSERVMDQARKVVEHKAPVSSLISLMITPSSLVSILGGGLSEYGQKNEGDKPVHEQVADIMAEGAKSIYPLQNISSQVDFEENLRNAFLSQVGIESLKPSAGHGGYRPYTYRPPRLPR